MNKNNAICIVTWDLEVHSIQIALREYQFELSEFKVQGVGSWILMIKGRDGVQHSHRVFLVILVWLSKVLYHQLVQPI